MGDGWDTQGCSQVLKTGPFLPGKNWRAHLPAPLLTTSLSHVLRLTDFSWKVLFLIETTDKLHSILTSRGKPVGGCVLAGKLEKWV